MKAVLLALTTVGVAIGVAMRESAPPAVRIAPAPASTAMTPPSTTGDPTTLPRDPAGHFEASVTINNTPIHAIVDTGADIVALTQADARQVGLFVDPTAFTVIGRGAGGEVRGQRVTLASVGVGDHRAEQVEAVVLENGDTSLLGQTYLRRLNRVQIEGDTMTLR